MIGSAPVSDASIVGRLSLSAHDLTLPTGINIDSIDVECQDLALGGPQIARLHHPAHATARISASSIQKFLESVAPGGLKGFEVGAESGQLIVSATGRVIVPIRVTVVADLLVDEQRVSVRVISVEPTAARAIVESQIDQLNPILDASNFPLKITISEVRIEGGCVLIVGTVLTQ